MVLLFQIELKRTFMERAGEASAFGVRAAWLHILAGGLRVIAPLCTSTGVPFSQETSNWTGH